MQTLQLFVLALLPAFSGCEHLWSFYRFRLHFYCCSPVLLILHRHTSLGLVHSRQWPQNISAVPRKDPLIPPLQLNLHCQHQVSTPCKRSPGSTYKWKILKITSLLLNLFAYQPLRQPKKLQKNMKPIMETLMQVVLSEFVIDKWKAKVIQELTYEVTGAILFKSTRRTKLIEPPYELHFTETTAAHQIDDLLFGIGPLYNFCPLSHIPSFLPPEELSTASLCVRDFVAVVVDITPLLNRDSRGKTVKFIEIYVTDPSIWPSCALFTVWEDIAAKYDQTFLGNFRCHFILAAQCVRPNIYKGKYGYQSNSITRLTFNPVNLPAATSLLQEIEGLAQQQVNVLHYPQTSDCFRNEPLVLTPINTLKASTHHPPPLSQDKHFTLKATVLRIWNESTLTYRCCPLCWTSMHEGRVFPSGCPKEGCANKDLQSYCWGHRQYWKSNSHLIWPTIRRTFQCIIDWHQQAPGWAWRISKKQCYCSCCS